MKKLVAEARFEFYLWATVKVSALEEVLRERGQAALRATKRL